MNNTVSIILPTYNRKYILERAIDSVIGQTYRNWELIIVDDASTDGTDLFLETYSDTRIRYIRNSERKGANYCRNYGVKESRGSYIAFLDSDNYWAENKLELQMQVLENSDDNIALTFCKELVIDGSIKYFVPDTDCFETEIGENLYDRNVIDTSTVLMKRKCFNEVGGFDEQMPRLQDWELFFRTLNIYGYKCVYIAECLSYNEQMQDSISKDVKKYIDASLYFWNKYPDYFGNSEGILQRIRDMFAIAKGEECYICQKICEIYVGDSKVLQKIVFEWNERWVEFNKQRRLYSLLYTWKLKNEQRDGKSLFYDLFQDRNITIAIYGLGGWGELFYQEIKELPVRILYGVDKKVSEFHSLLIKKPTEELERADYLVVTVFREYEKIKESLQHSFQGEIISIEMLIRQA